MMHIAADSQAADLLHVTAVCGDTLPQVAYTAKQQCLTGGTEMKFASKKGDSGLKD